MRTEYSIMSHLQHYAFYEKFKQVLTVTVPECHIGLLNNFNMVIGWPFFVFSYGLSVWLII